MYIIFQPAEEDTDRVNTENKDHFYYKVKIHSHSHNYMDG